MTVSCVHEFAPSDRYTYDFGLCSYANGWAQIDTWQDAPWFGVWTNPWQRRILSYCEGDVTLQNAETDEDYVGILRACLDFYADSGPCSIDPGIDRRFRKRFAELGLATCLR